jgi:signal transduction histidine kinase
MPMSTPWFTSMQARILRRVDRFMPPNVKDADTLRRARSAVLLGFIGAGFSGLTGLIYWWLGSPTLAAAVSIIVVGCLWSPYGIRRGVSFAGVAHGVTLCTWLTTFVVVQRTGGFASPALLWSVLLPITMYPVGGRRGSLIWAGMAALQLVLSFTFDRLGVPVAQDFPPAVIDVLRFSAIGLVVGANLVVVFVVDTVRQASEEAILKARQTMERERILSDMHDGLGSQLLGIMLQVRARKMPHDELMQALESCVDDLRLIVNSVDPTEPSLEVGLAELRARVAPRCEAANVALRWRVDLDVHQPLPPATHLQVLRSVQEMLTNALRHARATTIDVEVRADADGLVVAVADDGQGFSLEALPKEGRGLVSLRTRAQRLGGVLEVQPQPRGVRVRIRVPGRPS